jgi:hypothetical protein
MTNVPEWQLNRAFHRVLSKLRVREISSVDRGANQHASIKLLKREQEDTVDISKAMPLWNTYVALIAKRDGITTSKAIDVALAEETGRELFQLAKLGGGGWAADSVHDGSGQRSLEGTGHPVDEDGEISDAEAYKVYDAAVREAAMHMSESQAHDYARKAFPRTWAKAKRVKGALHPNNPPAPYDSPGRSKTMLPMSHDGNAGRGYGRV